MNISLELMRRYIKGKFFDEKLFDLFLRGTWYPSFDDYSNYLKSVEKENYQFYQLLEKNSYVRPTDEVLELCANKNYSVSDFFSSNPSFILESKYGKVTLETVFPKVSLHRNSHLISNGFYEDTEQLVCQILDVDGSFTVGVCGKRGSDFLEENRQNYLQLMWEKKISVSYHKQDLGPNKIYMWHHRGGQGK